jgi:predicted transposase YbfD/YdcC
MPSILKKTVETVIATGNHILVQLKGNQPSLQASMVDYAKSQPPVDQAYTYDLGQRNRIEQRTAEVWPLSPGVGTEPWHDHFQALVRVQRQTERFSTKLKDWTRSEDTAYYLCDQPLSAAQFNHAIRAHWAIESAPQAHKGKEVQDELKLCA